MYSSVKYIETETSFVGTGPDQLRSLTEWSFQISEPQWIFSCKSIFIASLVHKLYIRQCRCLLELGRILDAQKAFDRAMDAIDRSKQIPWDDDSGTYVTRPARSQLGYFRTSGGGVVVSAVSLWLRGLEFDSRCRRKTLSETLQIQKNYCVVALRKSLKGRSNNTLKDAKSGDLKYLRTGIPLRSTLAAVSLHYEPVNFFCKIKNSEGRRL